MLVFLHRSTNSSATWAVCDPSSQRWHCYHSQLMFMWFSCTETYQWSPCISSSFVIYWCWHIFVFKMSHNFNTAFDYLLMLIIFHVQNVLIIYNWCLCDFLVLKHIDEVVCNLSSFVIYWCWHIFCVENTSRTSILLLIIYWCWLLFMCKMFLSFSTNVYVIFLYWNILTKWMHFISICHLLMLICFNTVLDYLLMLTIFHVQNVLIIFDRCLCDFLVLKHIDEVDALHLHLSLTYFLCGKYSRISILLLIIYWC